jgi:hypothetical protein
MNNIGSNLNSNSIPMKSQILQNNIGQNIPEIINNNLPNLNILPNNGINSMEFIPNQNMMNNQLNNLPNQNVQINPNNILGNQINQINDQMPNLEEQNQKRQKMKAESGKNLSNLLSQNKNSNFMNHNNLFNEVLPNNETEHKILSSSSLNFTDKIRFMLNQLNENNIKEKANEIKQLCNNNDTLLHQFSDTLIKARVMNEENNHELYFKLITQIDFKDFINFQIADTIKCIHKILNINSKQLEEGQERSLLKSLGNWLGKLTLSRNKTILAKDLDFRDLLMKAFETGKINVIVPFI